MRFVFQSLALIAFFCGARAQQRPIVVPQAVYAPIGSNYSVVCSCEQCTPPFVLSFVFNNQPTPPDPLRYTTTTGVTATLKVTNVQVSDAKVNIACQTASGQASEPLGVTVYQATVTNALAEIGKSKSVNMTVNVLALNSMFGFGTWYKGEFGVGKNNSVVANNVDGYTFTNTVTNMTNGTLFLLNATYQLVISKPEMKHAGPYFVLFAPDAGVYVSSYVYTLPALTFEPAPEGGKSYSTYDGSTFTVSCVAPGYPQPSAIQWTLEFANGQPTVDAAQWPRAALSSNRLNQTNGTIQIVDIDYTERATFKCFAVTSAGNATIGHLVRVKDPLAPLWPAIGVAAEIIILAVVILMYEKYKDRFSSSDADEDDNGHADGGHSDGHSQPSGVELRQRTTH